MPWVKSIIQLVVLVKSSTTSAESVDGVLNKWSVKTVIVIYGNNGLVYVRNRIIDDVLCFSEGCLKLVEAVNIKSNNMRQNDGGLVGLKLMLKKH